MLELNTIDALPRHAVLYVYGAGRGGAIVLDALRRRPDLTVAAVVDRTPRGDLAGVPVIDVAALAAQATRDVPVVIASQHRFEIATALAANGFRVLFDGTPLIARALAAERPAWPARLRAAARFAVWAPVVLLARLLRPVVLIRFGHMRSDRIGHWVAELEFYLCERESGRWEEGQRPRRVIDLFHYDDGIANEQLRRMSDRVIRASPWVRHLRAVNARIPGGRPHMVRIAARDEHHTRDMEGWFARTPPHLSFTADEIARGRRGIERLGLSPDAPFVCVIVRDPAYLKAWKPGIDTSYHDHRNADIHRHLPAMRALAERGYNVLRMGSAVTGPLETDDPRIVDYATRFRDDFMDMFLMAHCRFAISTSTGLDFVSLVFRRPVVLTNFVPLDLAVFWMPLALSIFKHHRRRSTGQAVGWRRLRADKAGALTYAHEYLCHDLELEENSETEITDVALEMADRLDGRWRDSPEDDHLQERFWALLGDSPFQAPRQRGSRVGAAFLRANRHLLD